MAGSQAQSQADGFVGRIVDQRFRIEGLLGEGAVGTVYRATDLSSGTAVAFKRWHSSGDDAQVRGRFEREAKALDTLKHPNIVEVYGHGLVDNLPYVVMELLLGQTLERMVESGRPLDTSVALDIARQMLDAIAHAHRHDVVHRDLKPDNVFVADDGHGGRRVKILDYGLAKFMTPDQDPTKGAMLTVTGMVMGTVLYMPPEQAAGSTVDLPVDVYAAGCVLFEMLTGRPPYLAEHQLDIIRAHLKNPIPRVEQYREGVRVDPRLQAVLDRAMAKKQTDRYPDAGAMLDALKALPDSAIAPAAAGASPRPAVRRPASSVRPKPKPADNSASPLVPILSAGAFVLLLLIAYLVLR